MESNTSTNTTKNHRARWAAIGAAVAVSVGAGGVGLVSATSPDGASAYVPTEPCRIVDTRPDDQFHVGPFFFLGANAKHTIDAVGDVGECTGSQALPAGATGLQLNVTPIGASEATNLRLYPGAGDPPNASNLNPAPGQRPIPNAVTVQLDDQGRFSIFNAAGVIDFAIDVVGYYTDHDHDDRYYTKAEVDAMGSVAAYSSGDQAQILPFAGVVRSVSLTPPADGSVIVNSSHMVRVPGALPRTFSCSISQAGLDGSHLQVAPVASGGQQVMSATRGFDVSEGVPFTAHLFCQVSPVPPAQIPANPAFIDDSSLTATFAPT